MMKTNKRTVWFLTLLSLVAVISIYYINSKGNMPFDGIYVFTNDTGDKAKLTEKNETDKTPVFAESYKFEEMRMTVRNERSKLMDQLTTKTISPDHTIVEKNEAYDEMALLTKRDTAETLMEILIKNLGYSDAFVRTEKGTVNVRVISSEGHSNERASKIAFIVKSNWEDARDVSIDFEGETTGSK
jgi:stage III sporulation protein AH